MSDFMKLNARTETRLNEYAMRLFQVEAHMRRGELRAARARLDGMAEELLEFARETEFPVGMVALGAQLGLLSGGGSWLRGRLPAALMGGVAGWLVGQSMSCQHRRDLNDIFEVVVILEHQLRAEAAPATTHAAGGAAQDASSTVTGLKRPGGVENNPGPA